MNFAHFQNFEAKLKKMKVKVIFFFKQETKLEIKIATPPIETFP